MLSFDYRKEYTPLDVHTVLRNGDTITLVMKNPGIHMRMRTAEYGKKSYNMVVPQTDRGLACFFSILRYLVRYYIIVLIVQLALWSNFNTFTEYYHN